jgi:hypothetical protein
MQEFILKCLTVLFKYHLSVIGKDVNCSRTLVFHCLPQTVIAQIEIWRCSSYNRPKNDVGISIKWQYEFLGSLQNLDPMASHALDPKFKVVQRKVLNCMGIFGTSLSVILVAYLPIQFKPCIILGEKSSD